MGNVTDSLEAIAREVLRARQCLAPACDLYTNPHGMTPLAERVARGRLFDTMVILDDALDIARREREHLAEAGNLLQKLECSHCGAEFEVPAGPVGLRSYCGSPCRQAAYRRRAAQRQE